MNVPATEELKGYGWLSCPDWRGVGGGGRALCHCYVVSYVRSSSSPTQIDMLEHKEVKWLDYRNNLKHIWFRKTEVNDSWAAELSQQWNILQASCISRRHCKVSTAQSLVSGINWLGTTKAGCVCGGGPLNQPSSRDNPSPKQDSVTTASDLGESLSASFLFYASQAFKNKK